MEKFKKFHKKAEGPNPANFHEQSLKIFFRISKKLKKNSIFSTTNVATNVHNNASRR